MADLMMRMAGRGDDGLAKAIATEKDGSVKTRTTKRIDLTSPRPILANSSLEFGPFNTDDKYNFATIYTYTVFEMRIYIAYHSWDVSTNAYKIGEYEEIGHVTSVMEPKNKFSIPLKTARFSIKIENYGGYGGYIGSDCYVVLSDFDTSLAESIETIYSKSTNSKRQVWLPRAIKAKSWSTSSLRDSNGFSYTTITFPNNFPAKVSINEFRKLENGFEQAFGLRELINTTNIFDDFITLHVPLTSDRYQLRIDNLSNTPSYISGTNFEILSNDNPAPKPKYPERHKRPKGKLWFRQAGVSGISVACRGLGSDKNFYVSDQDGNIKKYDDIIKYNSTPIETGINFYSSIGKSKTEAPLVAIRALPNSVLYFANVGGKGTIYQANNITTTPTQVYQSTDANSGFNRNFGIDAYANGSATSRTGVVVASTYGRGQVARDLIVSKDSGKTFSVVKKTQNLTSHNSNSHWHDVAIDIYRGFIWASEGDGKNASIHYSDDWGESWQKVPGNEQPTAIIPFPDKVVLGRDGKLVGVDVINFEDSLSLAMTAPKDYQDFSKAQASLFYARKPVVDDLEAYISFEVTSSIKQPKMVVATGDGGDTWHSVWMGDTNIGNFCMMDDNYVYAYDNWSASVIYAERLKFE